jgi:nicotinamide-nucleotide amidase
VAVSVTGIAGPDGGSREKPVGTVHIAWVRCDDVVHSARYRFAGDRTAVRRQAVASALKGVCELLNGRM